jgi:hypothetical protein
MLRMRSTFSREIFRILLVVELGLNNGWSYFKSVRVHGHKTFSDTATKFNMAPDN